MALVDERLSQQSRATARAAQSLGGINNDSRSFANLAELRTGYRLNRTEREVDRIWAVAPLATGLERHGQQQEIAHWVSHLIRPDRHFSKRRGNRRS